jgi:hypothetical protein
MPQNIVVGDEAEQVAEFVANFSGDDVEKPPGPAAAGEAGTGDAAESE